MDIINSLRRSYHLSGIEGMLSHVSRGTFIKYIDQKTGRLCQPLKSGICGAYWIAIDEVVNTSAKVYMDFHGPNANPGICGGNWDRYVFDIVEHPLYQMLEDRFVYGTAWKDTDYYNYCVEKLEYDGAAWNSCNSIEDLDKRCEEIESLYDDIQSNGLLPWFDRESSEETRVGDYMVPDELLIGLSRTGKPIRLENGRHRLMIGKILDIEMIPAVVTVIHKDLHKEKDITDIGPICSKIDNRHTQSYRWS